jgi:hypothetical protein
MHTKFLLENLWDQTPWDTRRNWKNNTRNNWVYGFFTSSGIVENRKHDVSEIRPVSVLR